MAVAASRAGARALERAQRADIETGVFPAGPGDARDARDEALGDWLSERDVQLVVLAGWMELLGPAFIRRFAGRIINVHPSLLPAFAGLQAIEQAVEHGVKVTGVTVHFVDSGVDTGAVILQEALGLSVSCSHRRYRTACARHRTPASAPGGAFDRAGAGARGSRQPSRGLDRRWRLSRAAPS